MKWSQVCRKDNRRVEWGIAFQSSNNNLPFPSSNDKSASMKNDETRRVIGRRTHRGASFSSFLFLLLHHREDAFKKFPRYRFSNCDYLSKASVSQNILLLRSSLTILLLNFCFWKESETERERFILIHKPVFFSIPCVGWWKRRGYKFVVTYYLFIAVPFESIQSSFELKTPVASIVSLQTTPLYSSW